MVSVKKKLKRRNYVEVSRKKIKIKNNYNIFTFRSYNLLIIDPYFKGGNEADSLQKVTILYMKHCGISEYMDTEFKNKKVKKIGKEEEEKGVRRNTFEVAFTRKDPDPYFSIRIRGSGSVSI